MADSVNMSLDEIIKQSKQNRISRSRGRGGASTRGRGGGRGRGRGRGGGGRGQSQSRSNTPGRSRSRGTRGRSRSRSQSRPRSRSQHRRSNSRARSTSRPRSQMRGLTPKGRAGLEEQYAPMPQLITNGRYNRGGVRNRLQRNNMNITQQRGIHSRLGVTTRRGALNNVHRPLAVAKRGISKRGRGLSTGNRYSNVGLRSDQILKEQRQNTLLHNNMIKSQTFTRSRNNSYSSASQLTVSVANDFAHRRRNSIGNAGYLNKQSLAQFDTQYRGYNMRRGPGSVKSMGSNRSNRSNRSNQSNISRRSTRSRGRGRGQGRGRGGNRGIVRNYLNKQVLNAKLQKEIAAIQRKEYGNGSSTEIATGVNFTPTPSATTLTLNQRFAAA